MKILIYAHSFAPNIGGAETYVMLLAKGLAQPPAENARDRFQVMVVTSTPAAGRDDATLPFRVVRRPGLVTFLRLIRTADVVHVAGPCFLPMLFGLLLHKPVVVEHHGYQAICPNGLLFYEPTKTSCPGHFMNERYSECLRCNAAAAGWMRSLGQLLITWPRRWLCRWVTLNSPISEHVRSRLRLPSSRVIYYGVPESPGGATDPARAPSPAPTGPLTFAYVGRLVSEKGLPLLMEAARRLKDEGYEFHLRFIGDGPERQRMEELTTALGLREEVAFTGFLKGEVLREALENTHAVVMPTLMEETAGLAAMEQMMRGRLVIVSDIGGLAEVVDGTGLKFACGDVKGLTACLRRVLDEPGLVEALGQKARARAMEVFAQERMVEEHARAFNELRAGRTT